MQLRNTLRCHIIGLMLIAGLLGLLVQSASADAVYLKDGFALHGKVRREADVIYDPVTGTPLPVFKGNFFVVDDRARWVIFDHRNVQDANPDLNIRRDFLEFVNPLPSGQTRQLPKMALVMGDGPVNAKWQRNVKLRGELGNYVIQQRLTQLNAYAAKFESNNYRWSEFYLTQELGQDAVASILESHPDLKEGDTPNIDRRLKKFRFLLQANWVIAAEKYLEKAAGEFPDEKDRIDRSRAALKDAKVRAMWDEAETSARAGRHGAASAMLARIPAADVPAALAAPIGSLKDKYQSAERKLARADSLLTALIDRIRGPMREVFAESLPDIRESLNVDTIERIDSFLTIAAQTEQQLAAGKSPTYTVEDVLALAVTGFVFGNAAAEPKLAAAERAWTGRAFAQSYLKSNDPAERRRLLESFRASQSVSQDEFLQLIALLPPAEPASLMGPFFNGIEERKTSVPWSRTKPTPYLLQLPLEYHHNRSYPVLIVLPGSGEQPTDAIAPWAFYALQQGYILASPLWSNGEPYSFTSEDQAPVLELIQDLRRRYNVDSDRMFLAGYGEGGTMATDVGLSHPDLFAGVVTMNARPRWSASMWYWHNAQYLPFYIVAGELAGDCCEKNRRVFQNWMNKGYPALMTIYKGRPSEFYRFEPAYAFDWMNRKRRAAGFPELGRNPNAGPQSEEFVTARHGDNRFYWLEATTFNEKYITTAMGTGERQYTPAAVQATIREGNHIVINARGIRSLRVWLGKASDPQGGWRSMIDFGKPVRITINRQVWTGRDIKVTPSLDVMLEDLYQRGDRQRPMLAHIDLNNLPG